MIRLSERIIAYYHNWDANGRPRSNTPFAAWSGWHMQKFNTPVVICDAIRNIYNTQWAGTMFSDAIEGGNYRLPFNDFFIEVKNSENDDIEGYHVMKSEPVNEPDCNGAFVLTYDLTNGRLKEGMYSVTFLEKDGDIVGTSAGLPEMMGEHGNLCGEFEETMDTLIGNSQLPEYYRLSSDDEATQITTSLSIPLFCINFLNMRNVSVAEVESAAPRPYRNRHKMLNNPVSLHVIHVNKKPREKVIPFGKLEGERPTLDLPLHTVRGHSITFTKEHPMFGKSWGVGTFWVPPHSRGNKKHGEIKKRYVVDKIDEENNE